MRHAPLARAATLGPCGAAALVWLLVLPAPASAQAIRGTVIDDTNDRPVSGAAVGLVIGGRIVRAVEADELGRFLLTLPEPGSYALEVERLGYVSARSRELSVELGDTLAVEFRVLPDAVLLEPLVVTGSSRAGRNQFARRKNEWGRGIFLGPEQIDSIAPRHAADVFRGLEKVRVSWGWGTLSSGSSGPIPVVRTSMGRGCMLYMLDRVPVRPEPWIRADWAGYQLEALEPDDLVAIEVYRYAGEAPPELRHHASQTRHVFLDGAPIAGVSPRRQPLGGGGMQVIDFDLCGLTVIWTRSGW